jgi:hypothetical protein
MWRLGIYKILMVCTTRLLNGWPPLFTGNQMYRRGEGEGRQTASFEYDTN